MTVLGQVDGVVAEPAADVVEDVAVDPAAGLPRDDTLTGRLGVPWWCGHRRYACARAFATVKRIEIDAVRPVCRPGECESDNGDRPCCRALVLGVLRIPLGLIGVLRIAFCA